MALSRVERLYSPGRRLELNRANGRTAGLAGGFGLGSDRGRADERRELRGDDGGGSQQRVLLLAAVFQLGRHDPDAAAACDEGRGDGAVRDGVPLHGLEEPGPVGRRGDVLGVAQDRAEARGELRRVSVHDDRAQLTAVRIGDPEDDAAGSPFADRYRFQLIQPSRRQIFHRVCGQDQRHAMSL